MPKYFDIHSHLNFSDYDSDRKAVIIRLKETKTYTITVGTDYESSVKAVDLADRHPEIYACIGIHPVDKSESFEVDKFENLIQHPKVVAVGECGLDFYHADKVKDYERQKKLFLDQVKFALEHDKPIMIHTRNAYEEILTILESMKTSKLRGNVHFFAGDVAIAERFFKLGFTVSFTGAITFTHDYDEVIKYAPLDKIMSETDSPYVAPVPYRGKRNEPSYVSEVVDRIAEIKAEDKDIVRTALVNNALSMIG
jgi:TatD DNase family protein